MRARPNYQKPRNPDLLTSYSPHYFFLPSLTSAFLRVYCNAEKTIFAGGSNTGWKIDDVPRTRAK
jgi:hypothetical protein